MKYIDYKPEQNLVTVSLLGRIDSGNAPQVEEELNQLVQSQPDKEYKIDMGKLEYISSAGLRVLLRLRKQHPELSLENVASSIYEILETTGFTEIMKVVRAYQFISVKGCEVIGQGANGRIYRIDGDTIVKVFFENDSIDEINRERELARTAFVMGIPTAIPYGIVRTEEGYGSVFEMLNARSLKDMLADSSVTVEECVKYSDELIKTIHRTQAKPDTLPDEKQKVLGWAAFLKGYIDDAAQEKICRMIMEIPDDLHMLHGDYHIKNIMVQNGETMLIDMDTLCTGNPIFELASMFNAYKGFGEMDPRVIEDYLGISAGTAGRFWDLSILAYLETEDAGRVTEAENKARIIGYTRLIRRKIRRGGLDTEEGRKEIDHFRQELTELVSKVDSLTL